MSPFQGVIFEGRPLEFKGAHVEGENARNIGIAFLGDYTDAPITSAQSDSAKALIMMLNMSYGVSGNGSGGNYIYTHGEFNADKTNELAGAKAQIDAIKKMFAPPKR